MFWRREWLLLLLSIISFTGFGVLVWLKPLGDGYAQTSSPAASAQLLESANPTESMLTTAQEKSPVTGISSGASESLESKATPSATEATDQGESPSPGVMSSIVESATSATEGSWQPAMQSSVGASGNSVILGGASYSPSSVTVPTMIIIPVSNPAPVEVPPLVIEATFDPLIESPLTEPILEPAPQPQGQ
jgi:hypothetical protein